MYADSVVEREGRSVHDGPCLPWTRAAGCVHEDLMALTYMGYVRLENARQEPPPHQVVTTMMLFFIFGMRQLSAMEKEISMNLCSLIDPGPFARWSGKTARSSTSSVS